MINFNDPFYGLLLVLGIILLIGAYLAFFAGVEEEKKQKHR